MKLQEGFASPHMKHCQVPNTKPFIAWPTLLLSHPNPDLQFGNSGLRTDWGSSKYFCLIHLLKLPCSIYYLKVYTVNGVTDDCHSSHIEKVDKEVNIIKNWKDVTNGTIE